MIGIENQQKMEVKLHNLIWVDVINFEKDEIKAFEWYKKSAEQGYSNAQNQLGFLYQNGKGLKSMLKKHLIGIKKQQKMEKS